ncbi:hypothetical protein DVH24_016907 [Malus domestica]|uniref:Uncharacterized protein n=1 Tax=Malus domestica TaxID=3750 RepID=A0A498IUR9_MALDO|nr:hypothetical protein DVH24_016907 [Malus domestica]
MSSSVMVSMADFLAMEDWCEKLASKISQSTECFAEKAKKKKDQWYKRNRKWEPTVVISRYPKDSSDAGQLQHLAAREGIIGAEIMELREASRKHDRQVESRGDVKAAFKILAKLNKRREKLEVMRTSMSELVR